MNKKTLFLILTLLSAHAPLMHCTNEENITAIKTKVEEINKTQEEQTKTQGEQTKILNKVLENQKPWYKKIFEKINKKYNDFKDSKRKKALV